MDRSPKDDTRLVMRGKEVEPSDINSRDISKSPLAGMGKRTNVFNDTTSLIPLQTPGKSANRNIRAGSPIHDVHADSDASSKGNGRDSERGVGRVRERDIQDSSKASSVRVSNTSPYQGSVTGVRSVAEMRSSPLTAALKHSVHNSPGYRNAPGYTNSPTSGHPMNLSPRHTQGLYFPPPNQGYYPQMPPGYPTGYAAYPPGYTPYPAYPAGYATYPVAQTPEVIAKAKKEELKAYYNSLTEAEKTDALEIFDAKFKILKKNHPDKKFDMFSRKMSLEAIHELYETHLKSLGADSIAGQFEMLLRVLFLGIEFVCVKWIGIDMRGFAKDQMDNIQNYHRSLIMLGEDWSGPNGRGLPPLFQIIIMVLLNAIVVAVTRLVAATDLAKTMGMGDRDGVYNFVRPLTDSYIGRVSAPAVPTEVDPVTKTPNVPPPRQTDGMLNAGLTMFGLPPAGDMMESVTSWGAGHLANMEMPQNPKKQDNEVPKKHRADGAPKAKKSMKYGA